MKNKIVFLLFVMFIFPLSVYGDSIKLDCPSEVTVNEYFTCTLTGTVNQKISCLSGDIKVGKNLEYVGFITADGWLGDGDKGNIGLYSKDDDFNGTFNIGTIKLRSNGNGDNTIIISDFSFFSIDDDEYKVDTLTKSIKIKESNTSKITEENTKEENDDNTVVEKEIVTDLRVSDITVKNYDLDFKSDVYEYTLTIKNEEQLDLNVTLFDNSNNINIIGNDRLVEGSVVYIKITNNIGDSLIYKINIKVSDNSAENKDYSIYFLIIIVVLLLVNVLRILFRKRNNNN